MKNKSLIKKPVHAVCQDPDEHINYHCPKALTWRFSTGFRSLRKTSIQSMTRQHRESRTTGHGQRDTDKVTPTKGQEHGQEQGWGNTRREGNGGKREKRRETEKPTRDDRLRAREEGREGTWLLLLLFWRRLRNDVCPHRTDPVQRAGQATNSCIFRRPDTWEFNSRRQRHPQSLRSPRTLDDRGLENLPG